VIVGLAVFHIVSDEILGMIAASAALALVALGRLNGDR
jgi:hypothetical protein